MWGVFYTVRFLSIYKWCKARKNIIEYFFSTSICWVFFDPLGLRILYHMRIADVGCKCWPIIGTQDCECSLIVKLDIHIYGQLRGHVPTFQCCRAFGSETVSLIVLTTSRQESNPYLPYAIGTNAVSTGPPQNAWFNDFDYEFLLSLCIIPFKRYTCSTVSFKGALANFFVKKILR